MKHIHILLLLLVTLLPGLTAKSDTPPRYRLTVLPLMFYSINNRMGDLGEHGYGINNKGQIVGDALTGQVDEGIGQQSLDRLALWQRDKALWFLISAQTHTDLHMHSTAAGINEHGQVIGNFQIISSGGWTYYGSKAFIWAKGNLTKIPCLPGDDYCQIMGLNNYGEAVGTSNKNIPGQLAVNMPLDTNAPHAFVYSKGKTNWLGYGVANSINDQEQIVGTAGNSAILWQGGGYKILGEGEAVAVNNHSQIVGTCGHRSWHGDKLHACLWKNGKQIILSKHLSYAYGLNNKGQIVGKIDVSRSRLRFENRAVLWQRGREYDLNHCVRLPKGWIMTQATSINDKSWIIGVGYIYSKPNSPPERGFTFLLTPRSPLPAHGAWKRHRGRHV